MDIRASIPSKYRFSKFGAWEKDVQLFIEALQANTCLDKSLLTDWLYHEGVILIQNKKSSLNKEDHYKDTNGKINYTTKYMIYSETVIAFNQLLVECTKKFVTDNEKRIELINTIGGEFMADVEANHYIFYAVQADILNSINAFIEEYPDTAREDIFKLTVKLFNEARAIVKGNKFEDVQQEIDDHLLLMTEFMTYVSSKSPIMTNTLFSHPAVPVFHFMQPPADATEAVRPPPLA